MKYLNQLEYPHIPYPTDLNTPDSQMQKASVKEAGCGLCSLCMVVDQLTMKTLPLRRCVALSQKVKANLEVGTNMKILGPVVAEKYGLSYDTTDDIQVAVRHLRDGGCIIANVGGDQKDKDYIGLFSHGGHYITLISADDKEVCVLDPSWRIDKYEEEGRQGKVRMDGKFVYCSHEILDQDASSRSPRYYLFAREK